MNHRLLAIASFDAAELLARQADALSQEGPGAHLEARVVLAKSLRLVQDTTPMVAPWEEFAEVGA